MLKSYYTIFLLCALVGILAGVPSVGLITQSLSMVFISHYVLPLVAQGLSPLCFL